MDHPFKEKHLHNIYRIRGLFDNLDFSDHLEIHTLDLTKFHKHQPESLRTTLEKWLHFLKYSLYYQEIGRPRPPELVRQEGIDQAMTSYQRVSASPEIRTRIELQEKAEHDKLSREAEAVAIGRDEGKLEGRLEGKLETQRENARRALSKGLTHEDAAAITGLSPDEIKQIENSGPLSW